LPSLAGSATKSLDDGGPLAEAPIISRLTAEDLPDTPDEWRGRIDYPALEQQLAELSLRPEMAGLAVAVVEDGRLSFVRTYGVTDRSTGAPVTPQTVFRWASVSKTATGLLAASLSEERRLIWIARWRAGAPLCGCRTEPNRGLTFGQLLSQQTGLTKNAYDERLEDGQSPDVLRADLSAAPLQCVPGTCHTYQNVAFDAASEILGETAGAPLAEAVSRPLLPPARHAQRSLLAWQG
jgi:beta-lactamase class C